MLIGGDRVAPTLEDTDALILSDTWSGNSVTYSFPNSTGDYAGTRYYYDELSGFMRLSAGGEDMVRDAISAWDGVAALRISESSNDRNADIRIAGTTIASTAWAYTPGTSGDAAGDIWIGADKSYNALFRRDADDPYIGSYEYYVALHEMGHSLGLKHPHVYYDGNYNIMSSDVDAIENTVMSYRSYLGGGTGSLTIRDGHFAQSLMVLDIAAIQAMYGADYTTLSGNTVYRFTPESGQMYVNGTSTGKTMANVIFRTLWDGGGTDTIDLSAYSTDMYVDLSPGGMIVLDTEDGAQLANLNGSNANPIHASANIWMSLLHEGDTRSLIENVKGGSGDDIIVGNAADNVMQSGGGDDIFDGGAGTDTLYVKKDDSQLWLSQEDGALVVRHFGGSMTLTNVEYLETETGVWDLGTLANLLTGGIEFNLGSLASRPPGGGTDSTDGTGGTDSTGGAGGGLVVGETALVAETGVISELDTSWQTVTLDNSFENPVVFAMVETTNGREIVTTRLSNVGGNSFDIALQESSEANPGHAFETVSYVVMEAGNWLLSDGSRLEVGTMTSSLVAHEGSESIDFSGSFGSGPHVFSAVQTYEGKDFVITRNFDVTGSGFELTMTEDEAQSLVGGHAEETIGWFAIEGGAGSAGGTSFWADSFLVDDETFVFSPPGSFGNDAGYLAGVSGMEGVDPVVARGQDMQDGGIGLYLQEDQSHDDETRHAFETVDVFVFVSDMEIYGSMIA